MTSPLSGQIRGTSGPVGPFPAPHAQSMLERRGFDGMAPTKRSREKGNRMRTTYRVLAYLIAFEVVVQATMIAWAIFGFGQWIDDGNTFNKSVLECEDCGWNFTEERGFMIHGINGFMIVPLLSLVLLIISFFAKVPGGVKWAAILFALVIVQSQILPGLGRDYPIFGALHGLNALALFGVAVMAGKRVTSATTKAEEPVATSV